VPKWGLTREQREARPWGLDAEYLAPAKVITDPIHGDIFVTVLEQTFIDTEPIERLRRIKQLGNTHLVYPGATHSRFAHSLGAVRVAQDLIDAVLDQRNTPRPKRDLFTEWEEDRDQLVTRISERVQAQIESGTDEVNIEVDGNDLREVFNSMTGIDRRIAEAVVAVRLGALLHDICHIPYGHSLEDELGILTPHDRNSERFERMWSRLKLPTELEQQIRDGGLYQELRRLILSKVKDAPDLKYPFVEDIVGNTICADLLDYLERDHRATGLPVALGRRFVSAFYVMPTGDPDLGEHMILKITRPDGRERTDVVTEVLKYLRYRYELSERALVHHAKLAADAMIGKALEMWYDVIWLRQARQFLEDQHVKDGKKRSTYRAPKWLGDRDIGTVRQRFTDEQGTPAGKAVLARANSELDDSLSRHGDDALLERLTELEDSTGHPRRAEAVRHLARDVLDRRLFKQIGTQHRPPKGPERMVKDERWGTADRRREAEEDAARWAGLKHRWQVLLWVPPHTMRLKIADVLVDGGDAGIMRFFEYERQGRHRGTDIYEAHRALWSIGVYIDAEYAAEYLIVRKVIARLAQKMNITFTQFEDELGKHAYLWPHQLAARHKVEEVLGRDAVERRPDLVKHLIKQVRTEQVQARGPAADESWDALYARYQGAAEAIPDLAEGANT
jgi:HD superfamily phosphohydrolase